ncbi:glycosyltransferase [Actinoplanes sp. TBRC 11911]|uniref:nucleotide disphospho-sugar-binding domain-containing protein n=1 Tax=Actinoplanes sp. TBRC 11911 TaxID=2729386 RepID=UPI00145E576E|nr:nucleotide disphospho-sugar-binding domain-containing protein [Actinoplanes sp. TBRC 11911]NMO49914.1 glycosyltransferase [Actinoplanes sp. TBRC 11911]
MATVLAYQTPAMGHLFPTSVLLTELRERGHRIALRTLRTGVRLGREWGFAVEAVDPRIEAMPLDDADATGPEDALRRAFATFGRRAEIEVDDLRTAIDEVAADVLIIDANCWGAAAAAEASGLPWLSFWAYLPYLRSTAAPPYGPGLKPLPGLLGRIRDARMRPKLSRVFNDAMLTPLNRVRARVGVPPLSSADDYVLRPPLKLVTTAEPFEYAHPDWDDSIQLIGPLSFDPAPERVPGWLAAVDRPIVLVSTSSEFQGDTDVALAALTALAGEPVHVVATFPGGVPAGITVPANATVLEFAPHGMVLDRAACAITHGGMGTTQKALLRGVPVCVAPQGRDQFEVARRVEVAGCGTRLRPGDLTPHRLREKVRRTMAMTEGARRVAAGFARSGGAPRGADLIEGLLR